LLRVRRGSAGGGSPSSLPSSPSSSSPSPVLPSFPPSIPCSFLLMLLPLLLLLLLLLLVSSIREERCSAIVREECWTSSWREGGGEGGYVCVMNGRKKGGSIGGREGGKAGVKCTSSTPISLIRTESSSAISLVNPPFPPSFPPSPPPPSPPPPPPLSGLPGREENAPDTFKRGGKEDREGRVRGEGRRGDDEGGGEKGAEEAAEEGRVEGRASASLFPPPPPPPPPSRRRREVKAVDTSLVSSRMSDKRSCSSGTKCIQISISSSPPSLPPSLSMR